MIGSQITTNCVWLSTRHIRHQSVQTLITVTSLRYSSLPSAMTLGLCLGTSLYQFQPSPVLMEHFHTQCLLVSLYMLEQSKCVTRWEYAVKSILTFKALVKNAWCLDPEVSHATLTFVIGEFSWSLKLNSYWYWID